MANTILVGAQWGDEGKGKIIDVLTSKADVIVRSQGGNNAGHTIVHGGATYGDKAARTGLRVSDLMQPILFAKKLQAKIRENNSILQALGANPINYREVHEAYLAAGEKLWPFVTNTVVYLHRALERGKEILFEGAQGTFLDIDHGTYPYVTSSNTTAGGACTGTGVPPHRMNQAVVVMKAYTTRVGEGPLPTEDRRLAQRLH